MTQMIVSILSFYLAATAVTCFFIIQNDFFGKGDLTAFLIWTLPAAAAASWLAKLFSKLLSRTNAFLYFTLALCGGGLFGFLWTFAVAHLLGPFFGGFSFPVIYGWMAGFGYTLAISRDPRPSLRLCAILLPIFCALFILPYYCRVYEQRKVVCLQWKPGPDPLVIARAGSLTQKEREQLQQLPLTGELSMAGSSIDARGPKNAFIKRRSKAFLILQKPVLTQEKMLQPAWGKEMIYVQTDEGWKAYPDESTAGEEYMSVKPAIYWVANKSAQTCLYKTAFYNTVVSTHHSKSGTCAVWEDAPADFKFISGNSPDFKDLVNKADE